MKIADTPTSYEVSQEYLECPHPGCGNDCVAAVAVVVNRGGEITTVTGDGTKLSTGPAAHRGVLVTTYYQCESDFHRFSVSEQFHKGTTTRTVKVIGPDEDSPGDWVIWRD